MSCRTYRRRIYGVVAEGGRAGFDAALEAHLRECQRCRELQRNLAATARAVASDGERLVRTAGEVDVWSAVAGRLDEVAVSPVAGRRVLLPRLATVTAIGVLLAASVAVVIRDVQESTPPSAATQAGADFGQLLGRIEPLLFAVANRDAATATPVVARPERERARELARRAGELAVELRRAGARSDAALASELEVLLLQIANVPRRSSGAGLAQVQAAMRERSLLFELGVREIRGGLGDEG